MQMLLKYRFRLQSSRKSIRAEPLKQFPACLEYCDLVFALNLIEWERMVEFTEGMLVESAGDKNNRENNEQEWEIMRLFFSKLCYVEGE